LPDTDQQCAKDRLEREIHQMTPVKWEIFNKLCQHYKQQPLVTVGTKVIGPRSTFAQKIAEITTAAEEEVS
jgi:hypothetical protein